MKKTILSMLSMFTFAAVVLTGCKSTPTPENMYATAYSIGVATGMVMNQTDIDDESRNEIVAIVGEVQTCVPEPGQSFKEAWMPIAQAHVDKLVKEGKIDKAKGDLILSAFQTAVMGIDYLFDVRYPDAKQYKDLTESAIKGFSTGLLTVFKPVNGLKATSTADYDKEAYDYLKGKK